MSKLQTRRHSTQYLIDYSRFHSTIAMDMPPYSAKQLRQLFAAGRQDVPVATAQIISDDDTETRNVNVCRPSWSVETNFWFWSRS